MSVLLATTTKTKTKAKKLPQRPHLSQVSATYGTATFLSCSDGLFAFDIQLGHDYPVSPPMCHYISYCTDRLNPNLYEDGKVCVSLLGTWSGRGSEVWCSNNSTLLQVIVSIQGLILVEEPYFNEAGYEKQRGLKQLCHISFAFSII